MGFSVAAPGAEAVGFSGGWPEERHPAVVAAAVAAPAALRRLRRFMRF